MAAGSRATVMFMFHASEFRGFTAFQRITRAVIALLFVIAFWNDIKLTGVGLWNLARYQIQPLPEVTRSMLRVSSGMFLLFMIYVIFVFWLVHFVLPITKGEQSLPAFWRLFIYGLFGGRLHGPAVYVRNGVVQGNSQEFKKKKIGVALLDLRSAMTLDKLHYQLEEELLDESKTQPKRRAGIFSGKRGYASQVRTVGPGLVFIKPNERITGSVDLRIQARTRQLVTADTRDGIRVKTNVFALFTLGQSPDILDVCVSGERMDRVFVIEWDKTAPAHTKRIGKLIQELGPEEEAEVLIFLRDMQAVSSVKPERIEGGAPYAFDAKRVEQAVYSIASRNDTEQPGMKRWSDWPQDVAAEKFRILLSEYPYLSLYDPHENNPFTMKDFKRRLFTAVRNTGALAFRVVRLANGMTPAVGEAYPESRFVFFPVQTFKRPAVLRDRGIKVIATGFSELKPLKEQVLTQLRDAWLSSKKKEENLKIADYELEATRIINHARIRAQQNMNYHLAKLLEKQEYPREALAMLIFQELEAAAANPETRKLLPENTLTMMNTIGQLLLQSQREEDGLLNERPLMQPEEED